MKKLMMKYPIIDYVIDAYWKYFVCSCIVMLILFVFLYLTGLYAMLVRVLDLKYNSPFIIAPIWTFLIIAASAALFGFGIYFHKYKRTNVKGAFHKKFSVLLARDAFDSRTL